MSTGIEPEVEPAGRRLTPDSPLPRRLIAWSSTRFPLPVIVLMLFTFVMASLVGSFAAGRDPLVLRPLDILGYVAFVAFVLNLRIYDEHKDFESDRLLYPDRLTVTGVMPLGDLRRLLVVSTALQLVTCLAFDHGIGPVTFSWLAATAWSLLMLKEFFVAEWLRARPMLYAFSHSLVMPLMMLWAVFMGARGTVWGAAVWWLCAVSVTSTFALELSRKLHAPEDELPGVDSYSKLFGHTRAAWIGCGVLTASTVSIGALVYVTRGVAPVPWAIAGVLLAVCVLPYILFVIKPVTKRATMLDAAAALHALGGMLVVSIVLIVERGLTWL